MSRKIEHEEENTTSPLQMEQEPIRPELTEPTAPKDNTASAASQKGRSVPSTAADGSIWLRYVPKDIQPDECDSSTQT